MFWIVTGAVVVGGSAVAWWTSGRAKPDTRRRSVQQGVEIAEGRGAESGPRGPWGPGS